MAATNNYRDSLSQEDKATYDLKLGLLRGVDPYAIPTDQYSQDIDQWPDITYPDLVNYFVFSPNPTYRMEEMRAYKGLEAHNQFTSGWVRDVAVAYSHDIAFVTGKVS